MKTGKSLKELRQKMKLTQVELAEKAGLHPNYYARLERGEEKPSIDTVKKLSKILKVSSSEILGF
ncbi:MAG TPA: helix-turn-helix transcriptional regulator [Patescibacteria group bacterium]|nr:helix-turn-helix transcriptional regulator [Patescibacteria group bacterium]